MQIYFGHFTQVVSNKTPLGCPCHSVFPHGVSAMLDNCVLTYYPVEYIQALESTSVYVGVFMAVVRGGYLGLDQRDNSSTSFMLDHIMSISLQLPACNFQRVF